MSVVPSKPTQDLLNHLFSPSLQNAPGFKKDSIEADLKLDQNEAVADWPEEVKDKVLKKIKQKEWNRYPEPYPIELEKAIANYAGVSQENVVLGPGSNYILSVMLNSFCRTSPQVVVARPSFPLYEMHLRYENIPYEAWLLNDELEYDLNLLPKMKAGSVLIIATPNNPVGNQLKLNDLETILQNHPETLVIADEAYLEYCNTPATPLLEEYANLLIVRTFSKTFGAAAIRLGYLLGHESYIAQIKKLVLPFLINPFTEIAILTILEDANLLKEIKTQADATIQERERMFPELEILSKQASFLVKPSTSNFFLLKFKNQETCDHAYHQLLENKILVRNVSKGPNLAGCIRLTIGSPAENDQVLSCLGRL